MAQSNFLCSFARSHGRLGKMLQRAEVVTLVSISLCTYVASFSLLLLLEVADSGQFGDLLLGGGRSRYPLMVGLAGTGLDRIFSGDLDLGGRRYNFFIGEDTDWGATTVILGGAASIVCEWCLAVCRLLLRRWLFFDGSAFSRAGRGLILVGGSAPFLLTLTIPDQCRFPCRGVLPVGPLGGCHGRCIPMFFRFSAPVSPTLPGPVHHHFSHVIGSATCGHATAGIIRRGAAGLRGVA